MSPRRYYNIKRKLFKVVTIHIQHVAFVQGLPDRGHLERVPEIGVENRSNFRASPF